MTWAAPWAWALAAAIALPIVAHLWSRRQPRSVEFPTLRFLQASSPVSRRLRTIQDWPLLALRVLIVLAVAAAAAGPTIVALARDKATAPLHRVIVVDEAVGTAAAALVARLRGEAADAVVVDDRPIASALIDAIAQAATSARRTRSELVLVWDGSRPTLLPEDLEAVPAYVGVRLEPVAAATAVAGDGVSVATLIDAIELPRDVEALRTPLLAALAAVRVPDRGVPVRLRWPSPSIAEAAPTAARPSLRRVLDDLAADVRLRSAAERSRAAVAGGLGDPALPNPRNAAAPPRIASLLDAHVAGDTLVVESLAEPQAPLTWWAAVAPVEALVRWERLAATGECWTEAEVRTASRAPAAAVDDVAPSGRHTRAAWLLVLALLLLEQMWRSRLREAGAGDAA